MKVALIQPNSPFLINERVFPNMGIVRVGTQLKKDGHDVNIIDMSGRPKTRIPKADVYGISSTTPQFPYAYDIHNNIKAKYPNAHTVLGGPHASALYELRKKQRNFDPSMIDKNIDDLEMFDTVFAGEGELDNIGLMFEKGWQKGKLIKRLDDVEIPDRDLIDSDSYKYSLFGADTTSIQTQRGCAHQCSFCCGRDIDMYKKVRSHSPERVIKELDELHDKYGIQSFMWYDDEINLNVNRLEELCTALSKRDYQHRGFIRSDNIVKYPNSVEWMNKAGFVKLCAGVESGSDRMLKAINKKTTSKMNSEARKIVGDNKIHYESFLLLGHPDETMDDAMKTYQWIKDNKPDDFDLNIITPFPGSKIYDDAVPSTKFADYAWEFNGMYFNKPRYSKEDSFYKGLNQQSHSNVRTNQMTNQRLKIFRDVMDKSLRK